MKYKSICLIIICLTLLFIAGCNVVMEEVDQGNKSELDYLIVNNGEIILPLTPFKTLNPLMNKNESYYHFSKLIFEGLFEFDQSLQAKPDLVNTYIVKNEGKTISLDLREDIYWHDGEKFTADDVLFTINVLNSSGDSTATFNGESRGNISSANIIDDYSIDINFKEANSNNLETLTFPIIPSHRFLNSNGTLNLQMALRLEDYIPIGTGPYKYISFDKFKSVNLAANELYRDGKPSIGSIMGRVLGNEELFMTAYEAGQINISPVKDVDWDKYKQNSKINTIEYISSNYEFLGFNFNRKNIAEDKALGVRKAIYYGINRQEIIQKLYLGHATQIDVPIHPNSWLISDEANTYGYNVHISEEILSTNGFVDLDGDGILEDENGNRLSFNLITNPSNQLRMTTAEMIREDLKSIGIEIILDFDTGYKEEITNEEEIKEWESFNNRLVVGDFDIALLGWQTSVIPELSTFFHSSQIGKDNFINYNNTTMDSILTQNPNLYEIDDKIMLYNNIQKQIVDDLPYISLFYRNRALLVDSRINGDLKPTFFNLYNGLEKCFIATKSELS